MRANVVAGIAREGADVVRGSGPVAVNDQSSVPVGQDRGSNLYLVSWVGCPGWIVGVHDGCAVSAAVRVSHVGLVLLVRLGPKAGLQHQLEIVADVHVRGCGRPGNAGATNEIGFVLPGIVLAHGAVGVLEYADVPGHTP